MYENYEELRDRKGLTNKDVSRLAGIPYSALSDWKQGRSTPKADKMYQIAKTLDTTVEYLITGKNPEKKSVEGNTYCFDDASAEYADFIYNNKDYGVLFELSRKTKPEDIDFVAKMIERTQN